MLKMLVSGFTTVYALVCAVWIGYTLYVLCMYLLKCKNFDRYKERYLKHQVIWNKWYWRTIPAFVVMLLIELYFNLYVGW